MRVRILKPLKTKGFRTSSYYSNSVSSFSSSRNAACCTLIRFTLKMYAPINCRYWFSAASMEFALEAAYFSRRYVTKSLSRSPVIKNFFSLHFPPRDKLILVFPEKWFSSLIYGNTSYLIKETNWLTHTNWPLHHDYVQKVHFYIFFPSFSFSCFSVFR